MGVTETRSRAAVVPPGGEGGSGTTEPVGGGGTAGAKKLGISGELVQDKVARLRLEKRLKRRKAIQRQQHRALIGGCVLVVGTCWIAVRAYRGWARSRVARSGGADHKKPHSAKDLAESLRRFKQDAPHALHLRKNQRNPADKGAANDVANDADEVEREDESPEERIRRLESAFAEVRVIPANPEGGTNPTTSVTLKRLREWGDQVNQDVRENVDRGVRFTRSYLLPPLSHHRVSGEDERDQQQRRRPPTPRDSLSKEFQRVSRRHDGGTAMRWEEEWKEMVRDGRDRRGPIVDYTDPSKYTYPKLERFPPPTDQYPVFKPLGELMDKWNHHDDYDGVFEETLMHFNYSNPDELETARLYREMQLPFKLYDVPELREAGLRWTDEYVGEHFRRSLKGYKRASGLAQESPDHYFAFFIPQRWNVMEYGLPPTVESDWTFDTWAQHARYADAVRLSPHRPHFYWQSGVPAQERHRPKDEWTFISRDLPSLSSPTETFFVWHPEEQKGIQCRFGERGVVAATHYDSGRNMVAMITGAKRYILSPPRACSKLGIFTSKTSPIYRHSLLNFAHIPLAKDYHNQMSQEERAWLGRASTAEAIDTVVKAGEVLYIPSFYFHYIVSLQKSAQCNVRSGIDRVQHPVFGGQQTVEECVDVRFPER